MRAICDGCAGLNGPDIKDIGSILNLQGDYDKIVENMRNSKNIDADSVRLYGCISLYKMVKKCYNFKKK